MLKSILSLMLLILPGTLCNAQSVGGNEVPFSFESGLVIVEAKIKGDVPVEVVLATGTEYSIVDTRFLEKYKLRSYYTAEGPVTGKDDKTYSFTEVSRVSIANSKSKDLNMRFGSMAHISQAAGREIFAALGADFFEGQIIQFDFRKKTLRFLDKSPADSPKDKSGASNTGANIVLRMAEKASNPFNRTFLMPVVGDVTFNGQKAKLLLDTGRATSLAFSSAAAKKVGFTLPAENGPPREDKVSSLRLGAYEITDVPAMLYAKGTSAEQSISKHGIIAGTFFLQNFVATFDFRNKVVILERS